FRAKHSPDRSPLPPTQQSTQATFSLDAVCDDIPESGLHGEARVPWGLSRQKGIRNGWQEVLTGKVSRGVLRVGAVPHAQEGQPKVGRTLAGGTSFDELIDKWASGVQPEQNTITRTLMHARRFE